MRPRTTGGIPISVLETKITKDWNLFLYNTRKDPNGMLINTDIKSADIVTFKDKLIISIRSLSSVKIK